MKTKLSVIMVAMLKKTLVAAILMCLLASACLFAQSQGSELTMVFDSFDGGGPSYDVIIQNPSIVDFSISRHYRDKNHASMGGAGYDVIITFKALKAGTTRMTIKARSPIADNYDLPYSVTVDESLNISIKRIPLVSKLYLERFGDTTRCYELFSNGRDYGLYRDYSFAGPVYPETMVELTELLKSCKIDAWNGFSHQNPELEDKIFFGEAQGEYFRLNIEFDDGSAIEAAGCNVFPQNYRQLMQKLDELLSDVSN